jgi:hypothetical protein
MHAMNMCLYATGYVGYVPDEATTNTSSVIYH